MNRDPSPVNLLGTRNLPRIESQRVGEARTVLGQSAPFIARAETEVEGIEGTLADSPEPGRESRGGARETRLEPAHPN